MNEAPVHPEINKTVTTQLWTNQSDNNELFSAPHAEARLYLGMASVGLWTILCGLGLFLNLENLFSPGFGGVWIEGFSALAAFHFIHALCSVPMDFLGGYFIPKRYQREYRKHAGSVSFRAFLGHWMAAASRDLLVLIFTSGILLTGTILLGPWALIPGSVLLLILAIFIQPQLAAWIGSIHQSETTSTDLKVKFTEANDPAYSGGITGWPGRETILIPELWKSRLSSETLEAAIQRRKLAIRSGLRSRGVWLAAAWNLMGLTLGLVVTSWDGVSSAGLIRIYFISTIWQFIGLLLLPTLNRNAVRTLESGMKSKGYSENVLTSLNLQTSSLQDGEIRRSKWVEAIFHPLPSVENRECKEQNSSSNASPLRAWHVVRMMLYLSITCGGILHRAVHCNVGRPDLWILAPSD
jgi:hypothetical protein